MHRRLPKAPFDDTEGGTAGVTAASYGTLIVTGEVPVAGARLRDKRNGFSILPALTIGTIVNAIPRPWWWWDFLTTEPLAFASLSSWGRTAGEPLDAVFDPTVTNDAPKRIKEQWPGKLVVKGVQSVEDAQRLAAPGVDDITLSNHDGRQLDRATIPLHPMPEVVCEVGKDPGLYLDADIVAIVAPGARCTLVGRACF